MNESSLNHLSQMVFLFEPFSAAGFSACSNNLKLRSSLSSLTGSTFFSFWGTSTTFSDGLNMGWDSSGFISRKQKIHVFYISQKWGRRKCLISLHVTVNVHPPCCMMRILSCAILWPDLSPFVLAAAAISFASYSWAVRIKYRSFCTARNDSYFTVPHTQL